jgi:signal peptidase I
MAPGLLGQHYQVTCTDCGRSFACGPESVSEDLRVVCPACGAWSDLKSIPLSSPDRLLVDRTAYLRGEPKRWSVVVCPLPDDPQAWCVKRLVGLAGERMTIADGDVYADGKILRKDWPTLSALAIEVGSSEHQPKSDAPVSLWRVESPAGQWRITNKQFEFKFDANRHLANPAPAIDWLTYHHEQIIRQGNQVVRHAGPILDDLAYNQNESRELVAVGDAILSCRLQADREGEIWLRANDGRKEFVVRLDLGNRQGALREADSVVAWFDLPASLDFEEPCWVHLALADCRLQLIADAVPLVDFAYDPSDSAPPQPTAEPFSIGALGSLRVSQWRIARDVYYLPPPGTTDVAPRQLGPTEYWLLGDNSAVAADSRTWPADVRMTRDVLIGPVWRWR